MDQLAENAADFAFRRDREKRRLFARSPKKIANVIAELVTRKGYGRVDADEALAEAWRAAAGDALAAASRPGKLRRGQLEVYVSNSAVLQELTFIKQQILAEMNRRQPDAKIRGLRLRIGKISS